MARRKDVYPQYMSFSVTETTDNTYRNVRIQLPVARRPGAKKITVIELLNVQVDNRAQSLTGAQNFFAALTFRDAGIVLPPLSDPNVFFWTEIARAETTSGATMEEWPRKYRYDTGGGRGFLIATDSIFAGVRSNTGGVSTADYKLLYRFVEIGLEEYIGIVQQQSSQT